MNFEKDSKTVNHRKGQEITFSWRPLKFGQFGIFGGLGRVIRLILSVDKKATVHARGDFAALSAIISGSKHVIWDCRAITPDQRIAQKKKSKFSFEYLILRLIEYVCAKKSMKIIVITQRAKFFLMERYRLPATKFVHISTCADLEIFKPSPRRETPILDSINIAFIGTLGPQYDIELINDFVQNLRSKVPTKFTIALSAGATDLYKQLDYDFVIRLSHHEVADFINSQDIGISIWREDMGVSLLSVAATKNAEFLACGKPVLVNSSQGDIGELVSRFKAGVATTENSKAAVDKYVDEVLSLFSEGNDLASRCVELAKLHYSLESGVREIDRLYSEFSANSI